MKKYLLLILFAGSALIAAQAPYDLAAVTLFENHQAMPDKGLAVDGSFYAFNQEEVHPL